MKTLRELLVQKSLEFEDEPFAEGELEEVLRECFPVVHSFPDHYEGRWRNECYVVAKIEDGMIERFFQFSACTVTGDLDWEDAGYCFEGIENVTEVYPKEITVTTYVSEEEL